MNILFWVYKQTGWFQSSYSLISSLFKLAVFINTSSLAQYSALWFYNLAVFLSFLCCSLMCFGPQTPLKFLVFSSSVNSLGISDELKQKLQDVMVDRHKLTLGKTLGEGTALCWFLTLCQSRFWDSLELICTVSE